jgi:hypothetical protein
MIEAAMAERRAGSASCAIRNTRACSTKAYPWDQKVSKSDDFLNSGNAARQGGVLLRELIQRLADDLELPV